MCRTPGLQRGSGETLRAAGVLGSRLPTTSTESYHLAANHHFHRSGQRLTSCPILQGRFIRKIKVHQNPSTAVHRNENQGEVERVNWAMALAHTCPESSQHLWGVVPCPVGAGKGKRHKKEAHPRTPISSINAVWHSCCRGLWQLPEMRFWSK